jgi:uncharacterized protein YndB with AHSA1/START domain
MTCRVVNKHHRREASMAEYERSRLVLASPEDVFAFVSDPRNLATFLPTVDTVEPREEGRVEVHGEVGGRNYEDDGWFRVDEARQRIEWGADERTYSGWLTVARDDAGTQVVAHLSLPPYVTHSGAPITGEPDIDPDPIEESLEAALDSLRNLMEGRGGKEEPPPVA